MRIAKHVLSISSGCSDIEKLTPDKDGNIVICGNYFSHQKLKSYTDAKTKLEYLATYTIYYPEFRDTIVQAVKDMTNCKEVIFDLEAHYPYFIVQGAVDEKVAEQALYCVSATKDFVFRKKSRLWIDYEEKDL
jgi:hypothetical protein